jgi:ribose transport system ATP-binding protein
MPTTPALRLVGIVKRYPGVTALKDVSFEVEPGEVHAIVGENGAGKSTLMGVACGVVTPDQGLVEIAGEPLRRAEPGLAQRLGVAVVYQHASVLDDLTVAENLLYPLPAERRPPPREAAAWVRRHLEMVGADVLADARAGDLGIAQRQLVELARALAAEARVLILDEPTESLTAAGTELLFAQIDRLRAAGTGIVYISHRFGEVRRLADRITVLRDGEWRGTMDAASVTEADVVALIVGRRVDHVFPAKADATAESILRIADLRGPGFRDVSLTVRAGEIVGMAGVEGNGQREVLRAVAGLLPYTGTVEIGGATRRLRTPADAIASGVVHLPADRHAEGAFLPLSVEHNVSTLRHRPLSRLGLLRPRAERELAETSVAALRIRTPDTATPLASLSGGNQQKVVVARSLAAEPTLLLADEPTRGVDVGSRAEMYQTLRDFADGGRAVLVVSADAVELAGLCDRVVVFSRGHAVRELTGAEVTEREITGAAIGATKTLTEATPARRRRATGDRLPSAMLAALIVALGIATTAHDSLFLGPRSLFNLLLLASVVGLAALGQLTTLLVGSIDLSIGPLIGLVVVVLSFFASGGGGVAGLALGTVVALAVGLAVGALNAGLIRIVRLPPVVATLVTYILLQGVSLLLRPQPGGYIDESVTGLLQRAFGPIPGALVVVVLMALAAERLSRRSWIGVELRAVGSDEARARQIGVPVGRTVLRAHLACSLGGVLAGVVLASVVGVGDPKLGTNYTLTAIAAVVLGGASIFGGRGSYVGAVLGALLLQEITSATTFLGLSGAWQEWLPGVLILSGTAVFSRRGRSPAT